LCKEVGKAHNRGWTRDRICSRTTRHTQRRNQSDQDESKSRDMQVVNEYPDIFLEELSGMPLDHDIEFIIELLLGTTHIYKSPYRCPFLS
jgi:hypothetical protein